MNAMIVRSCQHTRKTLLIPSTAGYPSIICAECGATIITVAEAESFVAACHAREGRNLVRELHEAARAIAYRGTIPSNGLLDAAAIEIATLYRARLAAREKPEDCLPAGWCVSGAVNQVGCDSPYSITLLKLDGSGETVRYTRATPAPAGAWRTDFENAKDGRQVLVRFPDWCGGDARVTRWVSHHDPSHDGWEGIYNYEPQYWAPLPADVASPAPSPATPPAEARDLVERLPEESTSEMKLAGARSIANSMHYENHGSRAELCWRHMVANFRTGAMPPVPKAGPRNPASAKTAEDRA